MSRATARRNFRNRALFRTGGFTGIERKFYDQKLIASALTAPTGATGGEHNPSATIALNTCTQGDGEQQRDGRKMTMKAIYVQGNVSISNQGAFSSADVATSVFIALVLDTQTNGALLNSEDVFVNPGANAATAALPMRNLQFTKRFKVLQMKKFVMANPALANDTGATGGMVSNGLLRNFKFYKSMNIPVTFSGTTETIANITDNSLHIVAFCSNTALAPLLNYSSRMRFVG